MEEGDIIVGYHTHHSGANARGKQKESRLMFSLRNKEVSDAVRNGAIHVNRMNTTTSQSLNASELIVSSASD